MRKISKFPVCNQEKSEKFHFSAVKNFMVEATTDAMCLSSHGGQLVLRQEEEHLALASQLSSCIHDSRTPYLVRHSLTEILMTRIFQICLGYEDVNDCESSSTPRQSVRTLKTKVILDFAKHHPMKDELRHMLHYYSIRDVG